ncbi:putative HVA22 protein g [Trifolium repens]|nr:putative HVA22 protein g [Trifolium repens]
MQTSVAYACEGPSNSNQTLCDSPWKQAGESTQNRTKHVREQIIDNLKDDRKSRKIWIYNISCFRIIVAIFTVLEKFSDVVIGWLPLYGELKLALFIYMWYPKIKLKMKGTMGNSLYSVEARQSLPASI